jgi:hypothetical protein
MVNEKDIINKLKGYYESVQGMNSCFGFAETPDSLTTSQLPATMFYTPAVDISLAAHHNQWKNEFRVRAITVVTPRMAQGGRLKYLENEVIPFGHKIREKFQTKAVVNDLLSLGMTQAFISRTTYGVGGGEGVGQLLVVNGVPYLGWITDFKFTEVN